MQAIKGLQLSDNLVFGDGLGTVWGWLGLFFIVFHRLRGWVVGS